MNAGRTVFSQLIEFLPHQEFQKCVARYGGDRYLKNLSCWDQYLAMAFAQLTYRDSLRDIEACLRSMQGKLYHMGFRGKVARSTLADANESRDWRIYADFAQVLIGAARPLYAHDPIGVDLHQSLYALDSTTIDLCLSLFPWAKFRQHKAAVKMHTLLRSSVLCLGCVGSLALTGTLQSATKPVSYKESGTFFGGTGGELLKQCNAIGSVCVGDTVTALELANGVKDSNLCWGYIAGVVDDYRVNAISGLLKQPQVFCLPSGVDLEQLEKVVKKSLDDNPARLHLPAFLLILDALGEAFPCK